MYHEKIFRENNDFFLNCKLTSFFCSVIFRISKTIFGNFMEDAGINYHFFPKPVQHIVSDRLDNPSKSSPK